MKMENPRYQVLNMCDFCVHDRENCGAHPLYSSIIQDHERTQDTGRSVIACDKYQSPVEAVLNSPY